MPSSVLLAEHTPYGDVCAVCGDKCHGTPSFDRPRNKPMIGSGSAIWRAWREAQVPQEDFYVTPERVFVNGSLVYAEGARIPNEVARQLGLDVPPAPQPENETAVNPQVQPAPAQVEAAVASGEPAVTDTVSAPAEPAPAQSVVEPMTMVPTSDA